MAFPTTTLLDDLKRTENPLSNGGKWTKLNWSTNIGKCFSESFGWVSSAGAGLGEGGEASGAYWNVAAFENPAILMRQFQEEGTDETGIWACTTGAGTRNGYRLKIQYVSGPIALTLEKWVEGVRTVLAKAEFAFTSRSHETAFGLTVSGGIIQGWYGANEAGMEVKVEAADSTFTTGKVGIENNKNNQNGTTDFRAASQAGHAHTLTASQTQTASLSTGAHAHTLSVSQAQKASVSLAPSRQTLSASQAEKASIAVAPSAQTFSVSQRSSATLGSFPTTALLDDLIRNESPLSNAGKWTKLNWATGAGEVLSEAFVEFGWQATNGTGTEEGVVSGAYWNVAAFENPAVSMRIYKDPGEGYTAIWACTTGEGTKNGYRLKIKFTEGEKVTLTLEKWVGGVRTELAKVEIPITGQTHTAVWGLTVSGGKVKGWYGNSEAQLAVKVEASDATFTTGKVGLEGNQAERDAVTDFRAASQTIVPTHTHTLEASQVDSAKLARSPATTRKASQAQSATVGMAGPHEHTLTASQPSATTLARAVSRTLSRTNGLAISLRFPIPLPVEGSGTAVADGTGVLSWTHQPLTSEASARAIGVGFLTFTAPPAIPPPFDDRWFYGASLKRDMSGSGEAVANGDSVLAT